jgi:hypothetical protein
LFWVGHTTLLKLTGLFLIVIIINANLNEGFGDGALPNIKEIR